jgi:thermitase
MYCKLILVLFLMISGIAGVAQHSLEAVRVILMLKKDAAGLRTSSQQNTVLGKKIDSLHGKYLPGKIQRLREGKKGNQNIYIIHYPKGTDLQKIITAYYNTGEIGYAEMDHIGAGAGKQGFTPNDPYYFQQWSLKNNGSFRLSPAITGADIDMENAWSIETGDTAVVVGIIDSGAKLDHPEFAGRIWKNKNEIPGNATDDDGNGYIDDVTGWDFANADNDPTDDLGHGTNVAGIIGANVDNNIGYAGVDLNCKLMILKGLDETNYGYYSWWSEAIYYAVDHGAKVINMSMGGNSISTTLENAVKYALGNNVTMVICMMNTNSNTIFYPAGIAGVIAVGSTDANDRRSNPFFWSSTSGSNYGNHLSVVAPGNYIYGLNYLSNTNFNTYWGGTSQAAPHVTGLASLLLAQNPYRAPAEIQSIIENAAEDQVGNPAEDIPGWDQYYGHGRINAFKALSVPTAIRTHEAQQGSIAAFPNPSTGKFTIYFPEDARNMRILNLLGTVVHTANVMGVSVMDFHLAEDGMYFLQTDAGNETFTMKILVRK